MQRSMDLFAAGWADFELTISTAKMIVVPQPPPSAEYNAYRINVNGAQLKYSETFAYLGSTLSRNTIIDDEVAQRISKVCKARSPSPPPDIPPNAFDVSVASTSTSSGPAPQPAVGMSPSRSFATLPAPRPSSMSADNAAATVRARTLPNASTTTGRVPPSLEAEAISAAWAACRSTAPPAAPVDATNSARATRIKPSPISPSSSAAALLATATAMASNASSGADSHYHPHYTPHHPNPLLTDAVSQQPHFISPTSGGQAYKHLPLIDHLGADLEDYENKSQTTINFAYLQLDWVLATVRHFRSWQYHLPRVVYPVSATHSLCPYSFFSVVIDPKKYTLLLLSVATGNFKFTYRRALLTCDTISAENGDLF
ncbi:unnamed protein product [Schistocephalus solidus]|uniref:Uncharacterized protein n=1 Tax=Schistocephalus solidus TaxID=70667 RepID=A0A183SJI4_SCHSO|nr:unnamed protein product [Schistocephalus solidus]